MGGKQAGRTTARPVAARKPAARKPAPRKPAPRKPAAKRKPAPRRPPRTSWFQRVLIGCALLAVAGALVGVLIGTSGSNRVEETTVVLDVRTPAEFATGHLEDAVNLDAEAPDLDQRLGELDRGDRFIVYCRTGRRAADVVAQLRALGFEHVTNAGTLRMAAWTTNLDIVTG